MAKGRPKKSIGLGDTIEKITEATGIKAVVEKVSEITGWDCGCFGKKEFLNRKFPYIKPECLIEDDYNYLKDLFSKPLNQLSINQQYKLIDIYERVFRVRLTESNCASCWRDRVNELKEVYNIFKEEDNANS